MWCASGVKGQKKTLCPQRNRGNGNIRWVHLCSPRFQLTFLPKTSTLPLPAKSPHQPTFLFMKSPYQLRCYNLSSKLIPFSCLSRYGIWLWGSEPLKWTLRKKIRSCATQSKKVKKTENPNFFFCSSARRKLNQSREGYQNMRQSQRRSQN